LTIKASSVMAGPEVAAGRTHNRDDKIRGADVSMIMAEASERRSKRNHGAERLLASPAVDMSIVICTLDRPQGMARAVRSCLEQQNRSDCSYEILIVDNSATARARELVQELWGGGSDCVRYLNEPRTNIAHARNAGIAAARGKYVAFMDDDMSAPPDWLANAIEVMERTGADVLLGKVVPEFEGDGGWGGALSDSARWFGRVLALPEASIVPTKRDGHIPGAGSGNCVLRGSTLHEPAPFDPEFGRVGGEDTDFLQRLGQRGAVTVFSERAWMTEFVPADRNTPAYLVRRSYRTSQQFVRIVAKNSPRPRLTVCRHMAAGAVQLALAVSRYGAAVVTGADPIRARIAAAAALGKILWMGYDASGPYR
jgi:succinoglycan biosynthesis protein ExoM